MFYNFGDDSTNEYIFFKMHLIAYKIGKFLNVYQTSIKLIKKKIIITHVVRNPANTPILACHLYIVAAL